MVPSASLQLDDKTYPLPVMIGTEGEKAIDTRKLRLDTGFVCYDQGYGNTGSCESQITFLDGDKGILRHRGYPIEQLAQHSDFVETAYLIIYGELPDAKARKDFGLLLRQNAAVETQMQKIFEGFPKDAPPMAMLSSIVAALAAHYSQLATNDFQKDLVSFDLAAAIAISKIRTIGAMIYRYQRGLPYIFPKQELPFCDNFLHMMFSEPYQDYHAAPEIARALNLLLLLHADHEQNCSTSTVRMVGSSAANLFTSLSAGICALSGPLHGGANMAVMQMLQTIHDEGDDGTRFIEAAKSGSKSNRLMGFGHAVYRNFDPRAKIIGQACDEVLKKLGINDPLLQIAKNLEQAALKDDYFLARKLYPNVDFYSGIIMRALGIPVNMFTVLFAIGRSPGWIANWHEVAVNPKGRIYRPRQIYGGPVMREYIPMAERIAL
jgi:citrate synthase